MNLPPPSLPNCVSNVAAHTSNSLIGETAGSGPSFNGDKYGGTLGWNFNLGGTSGGLTYYMVYDVRLWNTTTSAWDVVTAGAMEFSETSGSSGSHTVDWYVQSGATHGNYAITAWLVDTTNVARFIVAYLPYYVLTHHPSFTPPPYQYRPPPGDDPPLTQPELPPTGPVGPGSSS